jgi:hypothetical protein
VATKIIEGWVPMKLVWLTEYFEHSDAQRRSEIRDSIEANLENPCFDCCHIFFAGNPEDLPQWIATKSNARTHRIGAPLRFRDFLAFARDRTTIYILTNADIKLDASASMFRYVKASDVWALSRWNDGVPPPFIHRCTQDTWALRGDLFPASLLAQCDFHLGVPGCDNAFAGRLQKAGYRILNYSWSVRADHLHASQSRHYLDKKPVERPYFFPAPRRVPFLIKFAHWLQTKSAFV